MHAEVAMPVVSNIKHFNRCIHLENWSIDLFQSNVA